MKENEALAELSSIRSLMERSAKFISLSGLSGVMAGIYALIGAFFGYRIVYQTGAGLGYREHYVNDQFVITKLSLVALVVLLCSIGTAVILSTRKARQKKQQIWNAASKGLLVHGGIPLITGGLLILILLYRGYFGIIAPACLIFYGLALVSGSHYTFKDIKWLGFSEILLGLLAALMPGYGLFFWSAGFGVLHIIYGLIMYYKYDSSK
ncbi:hypothetical protein [Olivibacter domesticus]|uniref:Uncharacterized protein n=1 Tax=Olivibacter domesticus TaxID=407022 RepID=A0A1H7R9X5_OLID1|nr:hypothetical protein [Olivibacter domesticus]SEL56694.1 hypothetical protein SAMN05661044_02892 [Olivibacter domesticus]